MKLVNYLFIFIFVSSCSMGDTRQQEIIERLELEGKPYFDQLVSTNEYESLLNEIERGDDILIHGAPILSLWSDASTSLSLKFSLSRAIIQNPDSVMNLIPKYFSVSDLCTIPYIEESIEVEFKHINESLSALENSSNFSESHTKCISVYKKIKNDINRVRTSF